MVSVSPVRKWCCECDDLLSPSVSVSCSDNLCVHFSLTQCTLDFSTIHRSAKRMSVGSSCATKQSCICHAHPLFAIALCPRWIFPRVSSGPRTGLGIVIAVSPSWITSSFSSNASSASCEVAGEHSLTAGPSGVRRCWAPDLLKRVKPQPCPVFVPRSMKLGTAGTDGHSHASNPLASACHSSKLKLCKRPKGVS